MSGHTPGPWRVDAEFPCDVQAVRGPLEIATTMRVEGKLVKKRETRHANARLIAAAPDMLAKLRQVADECGHCDRGIVWDSSVPTDCESCADIRALIAKATQP